MKIVRIVSPFTDYYDAAAGYDDDTEPTYIRESRVTVLRGSLRRGGRTGPSRWGADDDDGAAFAMRHIDSTLIAAKEAPWVSEAQVMVVGFCGMVAPLWRWNNRVWWDPLPLAQAANADARYVIAGVWASWPPSDAEQRENLALFRALDVPAFVVSSEPEFRLTRNPRLGAVDFQRIVDPYTARQAVRNYLGNELAKQVDPMAVLSDEDIRDTKGFDARSFKAAPGGPGRKRKKKT